jgi:DMSO/TMAO reductase YedYZ molybdopterin-dependent catalytic subunit
MSRLVTRRSALLAGAGAALSGCDRLSLDPRFRRTLEGAETWSRVSQRALLTRQPLAREYGVSDISPRFKANGTIRPAGERYAQLMAGGFVDWRLRIEGLVERPLSLSLEQLCALPARRQITRHDCVEGWSAIGQWVGAPLSTVLRLAGVRPQARFVVFRCLDNLAGEPDKGGDQAPGQYYESIDLFDAWHPQTILAYGMNGRPLPVAYGAPLRLRVERQLGYKHAKYLDRIQLVDSLDSLYGGRGGYWEDRGYEWYAGI